MRIFVTGATGFIGSHVAYQLLNAGHDLVIIARNPQKLPWLTAHPKVKRVTATLYDNDTIHNLLPGCEACIHIALGWGDRDRVGRGMLRHFFRRGSPSM